MGKCLEFYCRRQVITLHLDQYCEQNILLTLSVLTKFFYFVPSAEYVYIQAFAA